MRVGGLPDAAAQLVVTLRLGIFQGPDGGGSVADMLASMDEVAGKMAVQGVQLLVMPELFLTGYNIGADALRAAAEAVDGPSAQAVSGIARRHRIALLYGYPELGEHGRLYNSALLIGADGARLANHRKLHLFGDMERAVFTPGDAPWTLADVNGVRVGVLICYDVEFPEMVRGLALRGADLVGVPTALMQPYDFVARVLVLARAYESQVYLAYANRCGREHDLHYVGESCIVSPEGTELARAGAGEATIMATIDTDAIAGSRAKYTYLQDRMPAHYTEDDAS